MKLLALKILSFPCRNLPCRALLVFAASAASFSNAVDYYASGYADYTQLNLDRQKFTPHLARFKFGAVLPKGTFRGVGLQAVVAVPLTDDEESDVTVEVNSHYGFYFTFIDYNTNDVRLGVSVGYTSTDVDTKFDVNGNEADETFESGSFSVLLQDNIFFIKCSCWEFEFLYFFTGGAFKLVGCGVGLNFDF